MKISILLPYKENFSDGHAGAVSLFVKDMINASSFKKEILVFGSTESKKFLTKNYINIQFNKKIFQSTSKIYIKSFLQTQKEINPEIIEVHNRPNYIKLIKKKFKKKLFLFFHNDPLSMTGSKTIIDRRYLLNNVDQIIFNSNWSQNRFFTGLSGKNFLINKTSVCYQSSSKTKINFKDKKPIISFVGKLNLAKGYDLFGEVILRVLNKHLNWKAVVFGDEPRQQLFFSHRNLKIFGTKSNDYILNELKKVSISVVCSRWNEPFGRTSLEAASRGCAVIISNKGGLPETNKSAIILKKLDKNNLFKVINNLIINKRKLLEIQKKSYSNFFLTHKYVSTIIDNLRALFLNTQKITLFKIRKPKNFKILHITNFNERFNGRLHYNTGKRLNNGFVRLGHNVLTISDRDLRNQNKSFVDLDGKKNLQKIIIENYNNFKADCVVLGHADSVENKTLNEIKSINKNVKICQWFLDPVSQYGPDYKRNNSRIFEKISYLDATFLTSDPSTLKNKINNSFFIPNPCDLSFETLKNYENNCPNDVFFAMSHGVHRGTLKKGKQDEREVFIKTLIEKNKKIKFDVYGMNDVQPVWGDKFLEVISKSSMGVNLSRGVPVSHYSSDRLVQLFGNGLLTFVDQKVNLSDFIPLNCFIDYVNINDLSYKLNKYKKDINDRKKIAERGRKFYLKYLNSTIVADFILSKTIGYSSKKFFVWNNKNNSL